jgi:hypothetical protein
MPKDSPKYKLSIFPPLISKSIQREESKKRAPIYIMNIKGLIAQLGKLLRGLKQRAVKKIGNTIGPT